MNRAIIGIGSNIDPEINIHSAKKLIAENHSILAESKFIETKPIGFLNQPNFLNGAILIETTYDLDMLDNWLKTVEQKLGRIRIENKFGPRTIDLDIVVWNGEIVDNDVYDRDFLRNAVFEVWPEIRIGIIKK